MSRAQGQINEYGLKEVSVRLRLVEEKTYYGSRAMDTPSAAAVLLRNLMKELDREWLCVVNLDTRLKPINFNIVSVGNINSSIADLSNIFKAAILSNASSILLAHNHPSGDITPSPEDQKVTESALNAGRLMQISLLDHLVFAAGTDHYYSFREDDPALFDNVPVDQDFLAALKTAEPAGNATGTKPPAQKKTSMKDIKTIVDARRKTSSGKEPRKRNGKE